MEVPLSTSVEESKNGVFRYSTRSLEDASLKGVFAFSFYLRDAAENLDSNSYIQGIMMYVRAIEHADSVFQGWKVVLYTDAFSYSVIKDKLANPLIELVQVVWPYYTPKDDGKVNGDIMRVMRFRSFFDFPSIPVFVRDADTLWSVTSQRGEKLSINAEPEDIYQWEKNFYEGALPYSNNWIFGTSLGYHRFWHSNQLTQRKSPLGAFAGFQSVMPTVPCFQKLDLWEKVLQYCLKMSERSYGKRRVLKPGSWFNYNEIDDVLYSNESLASRIGKDEQILTFVFLPECIDHVFFFELALVYTRTIKTKGKNLSNSNYPSVILAQGSNMDLKGLFEKGIRTGFQLNLAENRVAIAKANKNKEEAKIHNVFAMLNSLRNTNAYFIKGESKFAPFLIISSGADTVNELYKNIKAKLTNSNVTTLYDEFTKVAEIYHQARRKFLERFLHDAPGFDQTAELAALKPLADEQDTRIKNLLGKIFSLLTRKEIEESLGFWKKQQKQKLLNFYEGKKAVSGPAAAGAGPQYPQYNFLENGEEYEVVSIAPLESKGGAQTRKQKKQRRKTQKRTGKN